MPRALITGITGQDGSYLTELLLEKGYEVHGVVRPGQALERTRLKHLVAAVGEKLFLHEAALEDSHALKRIITQVTPDELYHLASLTHVGLSFEQPEQTCDMTGMGTLRLLEIVKAMPKPPKFFHASSSEVFGKPESAPQDENTPFRPVTPYGCAKAFATNMVSVYRQTHGLFACNAILFNHESPRRGENFVTQKICRAAAAIKLGKQNELVLGTITSFRDWGHARDYVRGMWLMLQQDKPADYVLATGELHTVQEVIELAFETVGLDWKQYLKQDPRFMRPVEPSQLVGNPAKAKRELGWQPTVTFRGLIVEMTRVAMAE
ncbi:MAG: GDP-mannose 4,6-dehydratase [Verrucomicrobia bacterium]|jgi:GDPmannose 4,6-dehydratase|nr:MAG: GDP-mannose 4,6-dehydratase [Verrucomicrobiota bacterium]